VKARVRDLGFIVDDGVYRLVAVFLRLFLRRSTAFLGAGGTGVARRW
jgi:hypothetical protein